MDYLSQSSRTKQTEDAAIDCAGLESRNTTMWLLGTSTIPYYQEVAAEEPTTSLEPTDRAERLYDQSLPHPTRSPITPLRSFFGMAMLAGTCILSTPSPSSAAELYPFTPPSSSQQRSVEREPAGKAQLSAEDEKRVSRIATQAKQLSPSERSELKSSIQKSLNEAAAKRNLNQVKYFSELLRQID